MTSKEYFKMLLGPEFLCSRIRVIARLLGYRTVSDTFNIVCPFRTNMAVHRDNWHERRPSEESEKLGEFVKGVLGHYNKVSTVRFFKISFLSEYKYFYENEQRLSPAEYRLTLDGCYSEDLDGAIDNIPIVKRTEVTISGESIETLSVNDGLSSSLSNEEKECIRSIVKKYGSVPPKEINRVVQELPAYRQTKLGEVLQIEQSPE